MLERIVAVDFSERKNKLRPVSSLLGGPLFSPALSEDFGEEYRRMNVPAIRLSGAGGFGSYPLDVSCIFADPALDPSFELSYDFSIADKIVLSAVNTGAEIILCLGESPAPPPSPLTSTDSLCIKICEGCREDNITLQ